MTRQLDLIPSAPVEDEWRIDERTREIGRRGVAQARAALAAARARTQARAALADVHDDRSAA